MCVVVQAFGFTMHSGESQPPGDFNALHQSAESLLSLPIVTNSAKLLPGTPRFGIGVAPKVSSGLTIRQNVPWLLMTPFDEDAVLQSDHSLQAHWVSCPHSDHPHLHNQWRPFPNKFPLNPVLFSYQTNVTPIFTPKKDGSAVEVPTNTDASQQTMLAKLKTSFWTGLGRTARSIYMSVRIDPDGVVHSSTQLQITPRWKLSSTVLSHPTIPQELFRRRRAQFLPKSAGQRPQAQLPPPSQQQVQQQFSETDSTSDDIGSDAYRTASSDSLSEAERRRLLEEEDDALDVPAPSQMPMFPAQSYLMTQLQYDSDRMSFRLKANSAVKGMTASILVKIQNDLYAGAEGTYAHTDEWVGVNFGARYHGPFGAILAGSLNLFGQCRVTYSQPIGRHVAFAAMYDMQAAGEHGMKRVGVYFQPLPDAFPGLQVKLRWDSSQEIGVTAEWLLSSRAPGSALDVSSHQTTSSRLIVGWCQSCASSPPSSSISNGSWSVGLQVSLDEVWNWIRSRF